MSWEANVWAIKQRMKLPQEQLVLIVLGNCADPDAIAFSTWPGRDHWWKYLSKITRLSRSSLFRHINTIVGLGLASRTMLVLADGSKRPTITLHLDAAFDIEKEQGRYIDVTTARSKDESHGETENAHDAEESGNTTDDNTLEPENATSDSESHCETVAPLSPTSGTESVPPAGLHIDSSKSSSKESPPTPSGGFARDDLWDQFVKAWGEPIQRMALTQAVWDRTATDKRPTIVAAAKGFWSYRRGLTRVPTPQSAQSFIRDEPGWQQWLRYVPDVGLIAPTFSGSYPRDSVEAKAVATLHSLAGATDFFVKYVRKGDVVYYRHPITPQLVALAQAPPREEWVKATREQAASWNQFLDKYPTIERRRRIVEGDLVPCNGNGWRPNVDGGWSSTGPPETLMSEQDMADFH